MNVVERNVEEIVSSILRAHDDLIRLETRLVWNRSSRGPTDAEVCASIMYAEDQLHTALRELASMAVPNA